VNLQRLPITRRVSRRHLLSMKKIAIKQLEKYSTPMLSSTIASILIEVDAR